MYTNASVNDTINYDDDKSVNNNMAEYSYIYADI